jgi:hypothetical protein
LMAGRGFSTQRNSIYPYGSGRWHET